MGLQMGRALGDKELAKVLNRVPDVSMQVLGTDSYVLVATDGALDPGHKDQAKAAKKVLTIIQSSGNAQSIVNYAVAVPTGDNVTAMLLRVITKQEG
jgi:serine/threonine protein phosphatase PrpC